MYDLDSEEDPLPINDGFGAFREIYPPMLNTKHVAEILDLNSRTVLTMVKDGRLPGFRISGSRKIMFKLEAIIDLLKASEVNQIT